MIIYSHSSINLDNSAKIVPIDFEIIGLAGVVKNNKLTNNKQKQNTARCVCFQPLDGLNKLFVVRLLLSDDQPRLSNGQSDERIQVV